MSNPLPAFCSLKRSDFPLLQRWLAEPHVDAWWHQKLDLDGLEDRYGRCIDGKLPTYVFIILQDARPIGFIQWYRWRDYPDYAAPVDAGPDSAGIDLAIGELDMIGLGIGSRVIREFVERIVFAERGMTSVIADPAVENIRSVRAFEKAGFTATNVIQRKGENFERRVMRL